MELWTAFLLGFAGSLHCAGMCGPLMLALPRGGGGPVALAFGRLACNAGRLVTYAGLGVVFGLVGRSLALAGVQRWVSIALGAAILLGVLLPRLRLFQIPVAGPINHLKSALGRLLRETSPGALFTLGLLNGLLPCGLVYVAGAGAAATGEVLRGIEYMVVFGLGTVPMMFGLGLAGSAITPALRLRLQRLIPVCLALVAVLLILRGLSLGIPYLSPDLTAAGKPACCH